MRTTVTLDHELLDQARELTGVADTSAVVREALTALIERESARRLALLAGSRPDLVFPPRHRPA